MPSTINASTSAGVVTTADTSGVLNIQTDGTTAISIDASQAVSFTNQPTYSGGTANGVAYLDGSKVLTTGSALVFDGSNLGLGVTPSAWNSVYRSIQLGSTAGISGRTESNLLELSSNSYRNSGGGWTYLTTSSAARYDITSGVHNWYNAPSGTAGNAITFTQAMTLDASGNLLVGTTSGSSRLVVSGDIEVTGGAKTIKNGSGFLQLGTTSADYLAFITNSNERARIDSSGNLLVGTTTKNNDGKISISASSASNQGMTIKETSATNDLYYILFTNSTGATAGRIEHTGATTVSYTSGSDVRLKTNIVDAGSAKEKIEAIKIREFDWVTGEHQKFGVIAQELIEVAPEAVCAAKTENDYWGVDYSKLVPSLIKYVQEQQALITQLQADVAALKGASA